MSLTATTPSSIRALLAWTWLGGLARLALASPFIESGVTKLADFPGAAAEGAALGLPSPALVMGLVTFVQLVGSALLLTRAWCWLGAGLLAGFTVLATAIAHPFWPSTRNVAHQAATFFEHVAIVGGLAVAALHVNGRREAS